MTKSGRCIELEDFRYLFIATYGRSGSTLLQNIIVSQPGCLMRGENHSALYGLFKSVRSIKEAKASYSHLSKENQPWHGISEINPEEYRRELAKVFVEKVLRPTDEHRIIGFKEIRYFQDEYETEKFLIFILATFPNSHIIFNKRTDERITQSAWYKQRNPDEVLSWVKKCEATMTKYFSEHPKRCSIVNYNEYKDNPEALKPLFEKVGLKYDEEQVKSVMSVRLTHGK